MTARVAGARNASEGRRRVVRRRDAAIAQRGERQSASRNQSTGGDVGRWAVIELHAAHLRHDGDCSVHDVAQVYGPNGSVGGNARVEGEAWVLGRVDGDAEICDLVVIAEYAHVGGARGCVRG